MMQDVFLSIPSLLSTIYYKKYAKFCLEFEFFKNIKSIVRIN